MPISSIKDLIQAGAHFGHRASRWNPKMAAYIHSKQKLIHIIDLKQTLRGLVRARYFLKNLAATGGKVLYVGTKRQAKNIIDKVAADSGMPGVSERWLGGTLTNYTTIRSRLLRLEEIESMEKTGEIDRYSKKMISAIMREKRKLLRNLDGIRTLNRLPAAMVVVDPHYEEIAVKEARKLHIPVVGLVDTDSDPETVNIAIPCNDDAMRSIQVLLTELGAAVREGAIQHAAGAGERAHKEGAPQQAAAPEGYQRERRGDRGRRPRREGERPGGPGGQRGPGGPSRGPGGRGPGGPGRGAGGRGPGGRGPGRGPGGPGRGPGRGGERGRGPGREGQGGRPQPPAAPPQVKKEPEAKPVAAKAETAKPNAPQQA